jgi:hypothetical protein
LQFAIPTATTVDKSLKSQAKRLIFFARQCSLLGHAWGGGF